MTDRVAQAIVPEHGMQADPSVEKLSMWHLAKVVLRSGPGQVGHRLGQVLAIDEKRSGRRCAVETRRHQRGKQRFLPWYAVATCSKRWMSIQRSSGSRSEGGAAVVMAELTDLDFKLRRRHPGGTAGTGRPQHRASAFGKYNLKSARRAVAVFHDINDGVARQVGDRSAV